MGEFSKRIGEIGEEIVTDFLSLIGWNNPINNIDIPSIDPEKHGKKSHGIDAYFHYESPLISRTLENVLISVKYSKDSYPNSPVSKFKEYYTDLAMAIESFKKSELKSKNTNNRNNIESDFDRGIIFWLNNIDDSENVLLKLSKIEIPKGYFHDGIFLIDNKKIEFVFNAIMYAKNKFPTDNILFTYFNTGLNNDNEAVKNGPILPIQYLASDLIPIRIEKQGNKNILILCSRENFEEEALIKLMGLAKNITLNFQATTILAFPDYNKLNHEQIVSNVIQGFDDSKFTNTLSIENFNSNFRN